MKYLLKDWERIKRGYKFGVKTFYSSHHLGVDYILPENTPIYAPKKCEIIVSGKFPQGGNTIHIVFDDHEYGRLVMRCMHLNKLSDKGSYNEGDIMGYTGNTGKYTTAPHLHLDISKDKVDFKNFSNFIDPDKWIKERIQPSDLRTDKQKKSVSFFNIGFFLITIWFLIGLIFLVISFTNETFFDSYPNLLLFYYLSWIPVIIISGLLINKAKNK